MSPCLSTEGFNTVSLKSGNSILPWRLELHSTVCNTLHMATNLALDDSLIEEARRAGKHKTKKDAVTAALSEYIRRRKQVRILEAFGRFEFDPGYDYKAERSRRAGKTPS
jgi:Arc/MetJ family transcription regulator